MTISPFTPLFFIGDKADGIESEYIQTFATTDRILIQIICSPMEPVRGVILTEPDSKQHSTIRFNHWDINEATRLLFTELSLSPGFYSVKIEGETSVPFRVTDDADELAETTLIQYSMKNNRQRTDAVFFIDGMQYFFDFRVPGGFKDSGWTFSVENEQFTTPLGDISQLYGLESTQKDFTLGHGAGVPVWFGEMLNRILVCDHVYFDYKKYVRKDASVPEMEQPMAGVNSFIFTQKLQQSVWLDPEIENSNHAIIRRTDNTVYRTTDNQPRAIY